MESKKTQKIKYDKVREKLLTCGINTFVNSFTIDSHPNHFDLFPNESVRRQAACQLISLNIRSWLDRASGRSFEKKFRGYLVNELVDYVVLLVSYWDYGDYNDRVARMAIPYEIEEKLAHYERINAFMMGIVSPDSSVYNFGKNYLYDFHILRIIRDLLD